MNEPFQNKLRQISVKNLLEGGRHSVIQRPPPCHNRQKPPLPPSPGRLNGELQDFSIITSDGGGGVSFSVVQRGIDHSCGDGGGAETALQKSNHAFFGRLVGGEREIAISTGPSGSELLGTNGSFGIEEGPQTTEVEKALACLSRQRRNLQSLEGISRAQEKCAVAEMEAVNYTRVKSKHGGRKADFSREPIPPKKSKKFFHTTRCQLHRAF